MANNVNQKYIIIKDRVEIYKDFAMNLLYTINYYYIDYESINTDVDIKNHYNWCFNRVCNEFLLENIDFSKNDELREYFYNYYYNQFYRAQDNINQNTSLSFFENFWKSIFDIDNKKNRNIVNVLIEVYTIFDKSINVEKNIFEIV